MLLQFFTHTHTNTRAQLYVYYMIFSFYFINTFFLYFCFFAYAMQSSWEKLEIAATCSLHCPPLPNSFLTLSPPPSLSLPVSYANKRTLLIFKLCRNCSANYQSFSTLPSDALELWPNICFLTLKSVGAGHAVCSMLSALLCAVGSFPSSSFCRLQSQIPCQSWRQMEKLPILAFFLRGKAKGAGGQEESREIFQRIKLLWGVLLVG